MSNSFSTTNINTVLCNTRYLVRYFFHYKKIYGILYCGVLLIRSMDPISEYIAVALASTFKFVGGPVAGIAMGLSWLETTLCSAAGMMVTVFLITYGSNLLKRFSSFRWLINFIRGLGSFGWVKRLFKPRKIFSRTTRLAVTVKSRLGLWGVAFLTPFLFTPILGTFIALSFRFPKREILEKMLVCGLVAGFLQTVAIHYLKVLF